jgi:hypothetical protein
MTACPYALTLLAAALIALISILPKGSPPLPACLPALLLQGIAPELRAELWPLLLGVFPQDSTYQERSAELERLRRQAGSQPGSCSQLARPCLLLC